MKEQDTITGTLLKTIYDDDVAILDYLADMPDRALLKQLQTFINFGNHEPNCILHKGVSGYTLLIYKAPFGLNKGDNKLTLFTHRDLPVLCDYFLRWRMMTNPFDKKLHKALTEIIDLLFYHRIKEQDNTQSDLLG